MKSRCAKGHRQTLRRDKNSGDWAMYCWSCDMAERRKTCKHPYVTWQPGLLGVGSRYYCNNCSILVAQKDALGPDFDIRLAPRFKEGQE